MLRIFIYRKIQRLRPGLNPRTQEPEASMRTTRPPKSSSIKLSKSSVCGTIQTGFGTSTLMPGTWHNAKNVPQSDKFSEGTKYFTLKVTIVICYIHTCCVPGSCVIQNWLPTMVPKWSRNLSFSTNNSTVKMNGNYSITLNTRAVRKVSSHFEYLENQSCGLDVNWQPVTDLNVQL
jgi:hypothetical protein